MTGKGKTVILSLRWLTQAPCHEDIGVEVITPTFSKLALGGDEWSVSRSGRYIPREYPLASIIEKAGLAQISCLRL
jgi:hypothetical protein